MIDIQDSWPEIAKWRARKYNEYWLSLTETEQSVLADVFQWWYKKSGETIKQIVVESRHPIVYDLTPLFRHYWKEQLE